MFRFTNVSHSNNRGILHPIVEQQELNSHIGICSNSQDKTKDPLIINNKAEAAFLPFEIIQHANLPKCVSRIPIEIGKLTLWRERMFKGEKLVPFIPTRFVLLALPPATYAVTQSLMFAQQKENVMKKEKEENDEIVNQFLSSIELLLSSLPHKELKNVSLYVDTSWAALQPAPPLKKAALKDASSHLSKSSSVKNTPLPEESDALQDAEGGLCSSNVLSFASICPSFLVLESENGESALDNITFMDEHPVPFDAKRCGERSVVAFPIDGRGEGEIGPVTVQEYFSLPNCSVCCDRLEKSVSGYVAPVCACLNVNNSSSSQTASSLPNSTIRCTCYQQASCPVCRALWNQEMIPCSECGNPEETWCCLVCGVAGCSRYHSQHAKRHCEQTFHDFSVSLRTQQIWDYALDNFVHRLLVRPSLDATSREGGLAERLALPEKLITEGMPEVVKTGPNTSTGAPNSFSLPNNKNGAAGGQSTPSKDKDKKGPGLSPRMVQPSSPNVQAMMAASKTMVDAKFDAKIEQVCIDYTRLLTNQLEVQRQHFERLLTAATESTLGQKESQATSEGGDGPQPGTSTPTTGTQVPQTKAVNSQEQLLPLVDLLTSSKSVSLLSTLDRDILHWCKAAQETHKEQNIIQSMLQELKDLCNLEAKRTSEHEQLKCQLKILLTKQKDEEKKLEEKVQNLQEAIHDAKSTLALQKQLKSKLKGEDVQKMGFLAMGDGKRTGKSKK